MLQTLDLFCGAGGLSLGFHQTGKFKTVLAVDNDLSATKTFSKNFSAKVACENIETWLEKARVPTVDVVIGGPPCQGFSSLNRMNGYDNRRSLWVHFFECILASHASAFLMENVPQLLKSQEFQEFRELAENAGFSVFFSVLDAANFGTPQRRKRAIVIGHRTPPSNWSAFPLPTHSSPEILDSGLPNWLTVEDAISDLPRNPVGTDIDGQTKLGLHFGRTPREISKRRYRMVPPGGNRFDLMKNAPEITPDCWLRRPTGRTDVFGRLWWKKPSVTIRTEFFKPEKGRYLHPEEHRAITHREAARLMGFPDDFRFEGSKTQVAQQIGNAVPPPLAHALGLQLASGL